MPKDTDDMLNDHLKRDGYTQSSSDPNNWYKRDSNGNLIDLDTDGRYTQQRGSSTWNKDEHNSGY